MSRSIALSLVVAAFAAAGAGAQPEAGWERVELDGAGTLALRYLPARAVAAVGAGKEVPAIVFLHGAGADPRQYRRFLEAAAEAVGVVLVLPKSTGALGWGAAGDAAAVDEAVAVVGRELPLDPRRTAVAGHSAGGAYAYLLAYLGGRPFSGVFTLAAPYYEVRALAGGGPVPPIRMFYGTADPNYLSAYPRLVAQWRRLGVPFEDDVEAGVGHGDLPAAAVAAGFAFLVAQERPAEEAACVPSATALCLAGGRFRVEVEWAAAGGSGPGRVVPVGSDESGIFWFFDPANWEMLVKVLDACAVDGHRWVFAAALTDVAFSLRVTDTATGATWRRDHPGGFAAPAIADTRAFACHPG